MKIGKNLKMLRAEREWTQIELAENAKVSLAAVKKAETDRPITMTTCEKLAAGFGVPVSFLTSTLRVKPKLRVKPN